MQLMALLMALALGTTPTPPGDPDNPRLGEELRAMVSADQEVRKALVTKDFKDRALLDRMATIDRANLARLKQIVEAHGWPGKTIVGEAGAHDAWLIVQHADRDPEFQELCRKLIAEATKLGEASGEDLAYLTDRVRVNRGEKQVYGTQFEGTGAGMKPRPIEDAANLDVRRKAVGLMPMAEYEALMRQAYPGEGVPTGPR